MSNQNNSKIKCDFLIQKVGDISVPIFIIRDKERTKFRWFKCNNLIIKDDASKTHETHNNR